MVRTPPSRPPLDRPLSHRPRTPLRTVKKTHEGGPWKGPKQFEADGGKLMMLPTDMVLLDDPAFKKWVQVYAKSEETFFADFAKAFRKLTELGFKQ